MKQHLNEVKRMQKLAGLITENRLLENEASQAEATADKVADKLEDKIAQLSPEQVNQLKADLDKLGITADTPAEEVVDKIEGPLSEAEGNEKQKIASALNNAGGGLMKSMLVPLIPLAVGSATGLGFLGGLGITIATAGLLLGLAKALGAEKTPKSNELTEVRQLVREIITEIVDGRALATIINNAYKSGQEVAVDGEPITMWIAFAGKLRTATGSYTLGDIASGNAELTIDGTPIELPAYVAPEPKMDTRTPEEKEAALQAWRDRYGPGGGQDTFFGRRTFD